MYRKKLISLVRTIPILLIFFSFIYPQDLELLQTFPGLPPSGRNGSYLGSLVTNIGDVNGDNLDDWAVGLQSCADLETSQKVGKVYIYFAKSVPVNNADPDLILQGEADDDRFSCSVDSAGDVNNDGYDDVIVGAEHNDAAGNNAGRAYIFYGGSTMDNVADIVLNGETANDLFGISVSSAGDVNNDGYDDVIVGAHWNDRNGGDAGSAYIYYGGSDMDTTVDVILSGEESGDMFAYSVSSAGDVNNDNYDDVIIGSHNNDTGGNNTGRAYIFYGGSTMDTFVDVIMTGEAEGDQFAYDVSSAGDVNNDGYDDVIIGANLNDAAGNGAGRAYIFYGGSSMDNSVDVILTGETAGDEFGRSVSSAGDVNNDNYDDVIVGAMYNEGGGAEAGRAYIYYGGAPMNNAVDVILTGEASRDHFGDSVSSAGDVNNDGYTDIITGAPRNDDAGSEAGKIYIYYGASPMDSTADLTFTGEEGNQYFGKSVSSAGDVNHDGYDDIIVGATEAGENEAGQAYIYFGGPSMDQQEDLVLSGEESYDNFGCSVSSAGDVNNDGYDDVIVGAIYNNAGGSNAGRAYIYFGGVPMNNGVDLILTGESLSDYFGCSVSSAGDVNNDGYDDVVVGAYQAGENGYGRAYVYFGGETMDNNADLLLNTCDLTGGQLGISVSSGDVNNDNYDDVIVGAYQAGDDHEGCVFIYYGGMPMDNIADDTLTGVTSNDFFGYTVSSSGDVNNDGYDDIIIGAYENDDGGDGAGQVYIYNGGQNVDNIPEVIITGEAEENYFGYSVSSAGDVNNDGYDDVVVGAYQFGENTYGRAYVYYGGSVMNNVADLIYSGESFWDQFGISVSSAGDVNGNGYADIIIGAHQNCIAGNYSGRAYVYSSLENLFAITIDGEKDAFYESLTGPDDGYLQMRWFTYTQGDLGRIANGDDDLSAKLWAAWDPQWLYIYEEVTDDNIAMNAANAWENDCMEIKVDPVADDSMETVCFEARLSALDEGENPDNLSTVIDHLKEYARKTTGDGYVLEMKIAWEAITNGSETVNVAIDNLFGAVLQNHDNDDGARSATVSWAAVLNDAAWNTPKYHGTVKFLSDHKLQFIPQNNMTGVTNELPYDGSDVTSIHDNMDLIVPASYSLEQNYPNPFNPSTRIEYGLPVHSKVRIIVYNILGMEVNRLVDEVKPAGYYTVSWNGKNARGESVASGIYIYKMISEDVKGNKKFMKARRFLLLK
jgi:hypothetical protein